MIFIASSDPESGPRGSRILVPLLLWLRPDLTPPQLEATVLFVRKLIHFGTFGVLAFLCWRALRDDSSTTTGSRWRGCGQAFGLTLLYAISDEFHQSFVPSRVGSAMDVLIDSCGAVTVLAVVGLIDRLRRRG